jgi:hypothetical protein
MCSFLYQHSSRLKKAGGVGNCGGHRRLKRGNVQKIGAPAGAWLIASTDMGKEGMVLGRGDFGERT